MTEIRNGRIDEIPSLRALEIEREFGDRVTAANPWTVKAGFNAEKEFYRARIAQYDFSDLGHVVDVGCGFGRWSFFLAECNDKVTAIDTNESDLEYGWAIADHFGLDNIEFRYGDVQKLAEWPDASFDALWMWSVFQHVNRDVALAECARVVKPGGRLFFGSARGLGKVIQMLCQGWGQDANLLAGRFVQARNSLERGLDSPEGPSIFTRNNIPAMLDRAGLRLDDRYPILDMKSETLPADEEIRLYDTKELLSKFLSDRSFRDYMIENMNRLMRGVEFDFIFSAVKSPS